MYALAARKGARKSLASSNMNLYLCKEYAGSVVVALYNPR